jgi:hypothetical protein
MQPIRRKWTQAHAALMFAVLLAVGALSLAAFPHAAAAKKPEEVRFDMVVSGAAKACLPSARGHVTLRAADDNQRMRVEVEGLPPRTVFTLFVLQVPTAPFAMSWYQGDIETNGDGRGSKTFLGIFSSETFVFAPASRDAPQTHPGVDALSNPMTAPVHMYHLGIWFSDPADAAAAGCPGTTTPFDGDHEAGIQVLNTSNVGTEAADGPLGQFEP